MPKFESKGNFIRDGVMPHRQKVVSSQTDREREGGREERGVWRVQGGKEGEELDRGWEKRAKVCD